MSYNKKLLSEECAEAVEDLIRDFERREGVCTGELRHRVVATLVNRYGRSDAGSGSGLYDGEDESDDSSDGDLGDVGGGCGSDNG